MTRLRRSLRGTAPEALSLEERYEKIISYVKDGQFDETLREFHMPSHVSQDSLSTNDADNLPATDLDFVPQQCFANC